jgi:hypothetical protein
MLDPSRAQRYRRHDLIDWFSQEQVSASRVAMIGAGALERRENCPDCAPLASVRFGRGSVPAKFARADISGGTVCFDLKENRGS